MIKKTLLFIVLAAGIQTGFASVKDSIGVERKDGKLYVLHRVDPKETLYSIARKYNSSVDELKKENPSAATALQVGQVLKVPTTEKVTTTNTTTSSTNVHKVQSGETLYSIATKYQVSVDDLKNANPGLTSSLKVGQEIVIPRKGTTTTTNTTTTIPTATTTPTASNTKIVEHTVQSGQTLYSIARQYNVSVDDIKKVNTGMSSDLKVGQIVKVPVATDALTTVKPTTTTTTPVTTTTTAVAATPDLTKEQQDSIRLVQEKNKLNEIKPTTTTSSPTKTAQTGDFKKITESGTADVMPDNQESPKYLAYHKSAPVGTIIQVVNDGNGQKIYVRVVGKLTTTDSKTVITLSKKAYERLGGTGNKLNVSLMYIP
jgi:LysM repeat protein